MSIKLNPLSEVQSKALEQLLDGGNQQQLIWLSGYFQGLTAGAFTNSQLNSVLPGQAVQTATTNTQKLTILFGSHTGRSEGLAKKFKILLQEKSIVADVISMDDYNIKQIEKEQNLLVIVSTHGEGEPPLMAEDFHRFITGKRVPKLSNLNYSVLALGDKSYKLFCQTGIEIDRALKNAGATELSPIVNCDVDYEDDATLWMEQVAGKLVEQIPEAVISQSSGDVKKEAVVYNRKNPFRAAILDKTKITGRGSDKEVYHVEIALDGSGISYQPGDSLGILADNPPLLVEQIIRMLQLDEQAPIIIKKGEFSILNALRHHLEITVLTRDVLKKYAEKTDSKALLKTLNDEKLLDEYLWGHDVLDLIHEFPFPLNAQDLVDVLRPLPPRLYSISSSQESVGDEVHITVSKVKYNSKGRERQGAASTYLADRIEIDQEIPIYIERNPSFRLPNEDGAPIIMVGAGTGIAPFRAFIQQREADNLRGKSWLFFGERHFHSDFLYQLEWQKYLKKGYLEKIDLAFSRDQNEKVYVQHRLAEKQAEIYNWLENGASFYMCGDMKNMAKDVQKTLLEIIQSQGGMSEEKAREYFKKLKKEKRFQADVY